MSTPAPRSGLRHLLTEIALTLLPVSAARTSLAASYHVSSGSMQPTLMIGDHMLAEPFAYGYGTAVLPFGDRLPQDGPLDDTPEIVVPDGHLSVMGDNRDNSADSRVPAAAGGVGLLLIWNLQGRVRLVLASCDIDAPSTGLASWLASVRGGRFLRLTP